MDKEREYKDILERIRPTLKLRDWNLAVFLITVVVLKLTGFVGYFEQISWIMYILAFWITTSFIFRILINKQTTASGLTNLYLAYDIFVELPLMSFIIYSAGGVEWIGSMFFLFPIVYASMVLSRRNIVLIITVVSVYYILLVLLPYFDIIPFMSYVDLGVELHHKLIYIIVNFLFIFFTYYLIGLIVNYVTGLFIKRTGELEITKSELEQERSTLEVKIKARTEELEELAKGLEGKVKARTEELEGKMKELEEFNQLAVGRELKMIELKKQIEELKKRLE